MDEEWNDGMFFIAIASTTIVSLLLCFSLAWLLCWVGVDPVHALVVEASVGAVLAGLGLKFCWDEESR